MQSWNLNIQREVGKDLGVTVGYFGTKGTHLRFRETSINRSTAVRDRFRSCRRQSVQTERNSEQHHADRGHGKLELQRALVDRDQTSVARFSVQRLVHVLEVDRLQLAEQPGRSRAG